MASSGGKGHHHTQAPLPPCCNCCRGAAMQPCSAVSKRKKPLLFGMVAFKTYFSPHCISNMRKRTEVFSNHFSLNIFYQKQIKWQTLPHLKDPPLLLGLHPIFKAFLYIWGEEKKKKINRSWCYWDFFNKGVTHSFHVKGMAWKGKCAQTAECAKQLFRPLT